MGDAVSELPGSELPGSEFSVLAEGMRFPEGPIAMPDGSVVLVEMFGPRITRVLPDGTKQTIAEVPGGPGHRQIGQGNPGREDRKGKTGQEGNN